MPQAPNQAATEIHFATLEPPEWQVSRSILILCWPPRSSGQCFCWSAGIH